MATKLRRKQKGSGETAFIQKKKHIMYPCFDVCLLMSDGELMIFKIKLKDFSRNEIIQLSILYAFGFIHWLCFFTFPVPDGGDVQLASALFNESFQWFKMQNFTANDWFHDLNYIGVIKQALQELKIPFHVPDLGNMYRVDSRFLGTGVYNSSPQIILLRWLEPMSFTVFNHILLYSIGFYGCLVFRKIYQLGIIPFVFLFLIFNFHGGFVEKVAAYGFWVTGYYFLPFVVVILFQSVNLLVEDVRGQIRLGIWLGFFVSAIGHQGSMKLYIHIVTFLTLWGIANYRLWKFAATSVFVTFSITFVRLLLMVLTFGPGHNLRFYAWGGYSTLEQIIEALVVVHIATDIPAWAWWEFSNYISIFGLFLLVYFALWSSLVGYSWTKFNGWKALIVPVGVLSVAAIRHLKEWIIPNWLPFYNAEDVTMRYTVTILIVLTFVASINFQGFCEKYLGRRRIKYALILILAGLSLSLLEHSRKWRMHQVQVYHDVWLEERADEILHNGTTPPMTHAEFFRGHYKLALKIENDPDDVVYISFFWIGLVGTFFSLVFFTWWLWKDPLKKPC